MLTLGKEHRHYLYIPQAASQEIDKYGVRLSLSPDLIQDIKIYTGIVYHFTEMRKMDKSRINHEFFKAVLGDKEHNGKIGYGIIKEHALNSVIDFEEYEVGEHSRIYWLKPELIDNLNRVSVYTEHPIPIRAAYAKEGYLKRRKKTVDEFLDKVYLPRMLEIDYQNKFGEMGENLIKQHELDLTLSDKKRFNHGKLDDDMNKIKNASVGLNHSITDKDGRVYNIMCYLKRELRLVDGINLTEVDISSSQPFILAVVLDNIVNKKRNRSNEHFIKGIQQLSNKRDEVSAKKVMEIIKCIEQICNGDKIKISQKYYKKNDAVFEKMMNYTGIKLEREMRYNTENEDLMMNTFVKKVSKKFTGQTLTLNYSIKEDLNSDNTEFTQINKYKNGHIPDLGFEGVYYKNGNVYTKDGRGYTKCDGDVLLNGFFFFKKSKCKENGYWKMNYVTGFGRDKVRYGYQCYTLCGHQVLKDEVEILLKATSTGRFYDFLIERLSEDESLFGQNLAVLKKDLSDAEYERLKANPQFIDADCKKRIVKMMVMRWLNDDYAYYSGDETIENSVYTAMMTVFPYITSLIFILRINFDAPERGNEKKKSSFHSLLSLVESEFVYSVVEKCNNKTNKHAPFLVGTVHDSFVAEPKKVKFLEDHIKIQSEKMFGTACFVKKKAF